MSEGEKSNSGVWVPSFRTNGRGRWSRESRGGSREGPARGERQSSSEVK